MTTEANVYHYSHVPFADEPKMRLFEMRIILLEDVHAAYVFGVGYWLGPAWEEKKIKETMDQV